MFINIKNTHKGFTLIELLVVIAIIGILASVVLASITTARQKSRDAKRVAEVGQIQRALEVYFDRAQSYPSTTPAMCGPTGLSSCVGTASGATGNDAALVGLADVAQGYLPKTPLPLGGGNGAVAYYYYGLDAGGLDCTSPNGQCISFALGANLERSDNASMVNDADQTVGAVFYGQSNNCGAALAAGASEQCYDRKP